MSNTLAAPFCAVEIYPFEGGAYQIVGGQILELVVEKNIRRMAGTFTIVLAPGGPFGANTRPSWAEVITPMSFCMIGMKRWQYAAIPMIGVITDITESQRWTENGVIRVIVLTGKDFGHFFEMFNWVALTFLGGIVPAQAAGQGAIGQSSAGLALTLGPKFTQGSPAQIASAWYNTLMMGTQGVLAHTSVNYRGQQIPIGLASAAFFEDLPVQVPFAASFITADGTWERKMRSLLDWPIYEFFVQTAPVNAYPGAGGVAFTMQSLGPFVAATPFVVGRINPMPRLVAAAEGGQNSITGLDASKWDGLPMFTADSSFKQSSVSSHASEARNFYMFNPTWLSTLYGGTNSETMSWVQTYGGFYDPASIHRYGFRPEYHSSEWFSDFAGTAAQQGKNQIAQFGADMTARIASWFHPQPLMQEAQVTYPLRPDIYPGNRFTYSPLKSAILGSTESSEWDFYIDGIKHTYRFGGPSETTLSLCRGLPSSVYAQQSTAGLLFDVITGNVQRVDGSLVPGLPEGAVGGALQGWGLKNGQETISQIIPAYATAQWIGASGTSGASGS